MKMGLARKIRVLSLLPAGFIFLAGCAGPPPVREAPVVSAGPPAETAPPAKEATPEVQPVPAPPPKDEPMPVSVPPPPVPAAPPPPPAEETKPQEVFFLHTVKWAGETLSIIAFWYTEDPKNWRAIAQANPNLNPHRIFGGLEILIPERLMKKHAPLPKEYVERFYGGNRKDKPKPPSEEPKLFGPKRSSR